MKRSFSVLLAEPNMVLREKLASILAGHDCIWCVVQVCGREGLERGAGRLQPDVILADLKVLKESDIVQFLRRVSAASKIVALTESETSPYVEAAKRLGIDGCMEKARAGDGIPSLISRLYASHSSPSSEEPKGEPA
jgi:DNA-binding NarL/FixJ family response regulator